MATYYRWRRSTVSSQETQKSFSQRTIVALASKIAYQLSDVPTWTGSYYDFSNATQTSGNTASYYVAFTQNPTVYYIGTIMKGWDSGFEYWMANVDDIMVLRTDVIGTFVDYVYSTNPSAYPNGGVAGSYYYDQRTTVTSPTAPTGLTYPNPITTPKVTVSWQAATSNVPDYPVQKYRVYVGYNGANPPIPTAGESTSTSFEFTIPTTYNGVPVTSVQFGVAAIDTNGQLSGITLGSVVPVYLAPTLTVPQMVMQGQQATISWTAIEGSDSYTLQRKSSADADWTQVYSGADLSYTETVGTWTSLQYRVCAMFDETPGGWATSGEIQIVSASALVISGSDGDLGTLTNDISYTVSSSGSTELTVMETINGTETRTYTATNGATNKISVIDLPTGYGTIKITASTNPGSGVVNVERNWTYSKKAVTFSDASGVANLIQNGQTIWAKTIAEAVRTPGIWGGNLGLALQKLMGAVLYSPNKVAKYTEVKVNLATAKVGQEINLPYNGKMIPHIVLHIGNPNPSLYDASCDGVWLMQKVAQLNTDWARGEGATNEFTKSSMVSIVGGERNRYDKSVADAMKNVKIPYCVGGGSAEIKILADGYSCRTFLLGAYEAGYNTTDDPDLPIDGAHLQGMNRSMARNCWLRTVVTGTSTDVYYANGYTQLSKIKATFNGNQYQTTFIMPTTFTATYYVGSDGTVHDAQEYEEAGSFVDILGNDIPVPQIETGSYVGTGTHGQSNPTKLTFSFVPKIVFINSNVSGTEFGIFVYGCQPVATSWTMGSHSREPSVATVSWSGNQLSFYDTGSASNQLNRSNTTFHYVAIGFAGGAT